jgi:CTD small phosphatase-like protein 2
MNSETNEGMIQRPSMPITKISDDLRDINALVENDIKLFYKQKNKEQENNIILNYEKNRPSIPFLKNKNQKKYTLVLDLEETLVHINQSGECILRPGLYQFLRDIKSYYELVSFSNESKYSSEPIIDIIEKKKKYFDYNLYREHLDFIGKEFIKDLSKLGRDIKKVIIVDNISNNFRLNPENGIQIKPFFGDNNDDNILDELKKILILFYNDKLDDLRVGIRRYKKDIINKITNGNNK